MSEADDYFAQKLHGQKWAALSVSTREKAIFSANEIINQFQYLGAKTDPSQEDEFPRTNLYDPSGTLVPDDSVPSDISKAKWEIAYALAVDGREPERDMRAAYVTSRGFSSVRTTYDSDKIPEYMRLGVPSSLAWSYLSPYLYRGNAGIVRLHRA